jgi:DMSO/TMAO reductase YedYZ molybdopterin-dependent catalytic subunit
MARTDAPGAPVGRRVFFGLLGAGAAGILWGAHAQKWLEQHVGPWLARDITGITGLLPIGRFRIYSVTGSLPHRSRSEYRLRVKGLVDRPLELSYAELRAMAPRTLTRDFQCVTGWRVYSVEWKGVRLADVLDRAGVQARARALHFRSFDGAYRESLTLAQARRDDVLVAYELEG